MSAPGIRRAETGDATTVAGLLHDFNTEFGDRTPPVGQLAVRVRELIQSGETVVLLPEPEPVGVAVLRFRPALWSTGLEAYLAELYVAPDRRGDGFGRALLEAAIEQARERGADHIDLGTSVDDLAARRLYESAGFTNAEGSPDGPAMLYYERDL